jgi:hypothetical protein
LTDKAKVAFAVAVEKATALARAELAKLDNPE